MGGPWRHRTRVQASPPPLGRPGGSCWSIALPSTMVLICRRGCCEDHGRGMGYGTAFPVITGSGRWVCTGAWFFLLGLLPPRSGHGNGSLLPEAAGQGHGSKPGHGLARSGCDLAVLDKPAPCGVWLRSPGHQGAPASCFCPVPKGKGPGCVCITHQGAAWDRVIMGLANLELGAGVPLVASGQLGKQQAQ